MLRLPDLEVLLTQARGSADLYMGIGDIVCLRHPADDIPYHPAGRHSSGSQHASLPQETILLASGHPAVIIRVLLVAVRVLLRYRTVTLVYDEYAPPGAGQAWGGAGGAAGLHQGVVAPVTVCRV